jgi:hypothetical protein
VLKYGVEVSGCMRPPSVKRDRGAWIFENDSEEMVVRNAVRGRTVDAQAPVSSGRSMGTIPMLYIPVSTTVPREEVDNGREICSLQICGPRWRGGEIARHGETRDGGSTMYVAPLLCEPEVQFLDRFVCCHKPLFSAAPSRRCNVRESR